MIQSYIEMPKVWNVTPRLDDDLIEHLLLERGIKTEEERRLFFEPTQEDYQKELNPEGIKAATQIIKSAIEKKELIVVYGDYDVDGICASAIGFLGLTSIGAKVLPYIPHREKEGYGLSKIGIDWAKDQGAKVIITVDQGIVAFEQVDYAKQLGMDIIITDHHVALDTLPKADAIVHSTEMCGAGVIWCLISQLIEQNLATELLGLVAIASICDMMVLLGVNRWFVKTGIEQLRHTKRVGLLALANECNVIMAEVTPYHIGHIFGPRLNAMGRLEHAIDSLRLICTSSTKKAVELATLLGDTNTLKKQLTVDAIYEAKVLVDQMMQQEVRPKILVVHSKNWIPGIIGIVAARLSEEYHLPTIVIAEGEGQSKASARTNNGVNIVETIRTCSDILIDVGGHPAAAGFTIATENIELFKIRIDQSVERIEGDLSEEILIDAEVTEKEINRRTIDHLSTLEPFGLGNEKPVLGTRGMRVSDMKAVGEGKHLKLKVNGFDAIAFSKGGLIGVLQQNQFVDVVFYLELNKFNGQENVQLNIVDLGV